MTDVSKWVVSSAIAVFVWSLTAQALQALPRMSIAQALPPPVGYPDRIEGAEQVNLEYADLVQRMQRRGMTLVQEDLIGSSRFELWGNRTNADYWLIVWSYDARLNKYYLDFSRFSSERVALNFFDCYYVKKLLQNCSNQPVGSNQSIEPSQFRSRYLFLVSDMRERNMTRVQDGQGGFYDTSIGKGENYRFELWGTNFNDEYWLFIWSADDYPSGPFSWITGFSTSREALDYFDCRYARKSLPVCPNP